MMWIDFYYHIYGKYVFVLLWLNFGFLILLFFVVLWGGIRGMIIFCFHFFLLYLIVLQHFVFTTFVVVVSFRWLCGSKLYFMNKLFIGHLFCVPSFILFLLWTIYKGFYKMKKKKKQIESGWWGGRRRDGIEEYTQIFRIYSVMEVYKSSGF